MALAANLHHPGLALHRAGDPQAGYLRLFSFHRMVLVHNILAGIVIVNAALSLFYHLASGEIRQYLPCPAGFFDDAIRQAIFYLRGIFKGEPHPFEKTPEHKLNPLQQATYFWLLNVLLLLAGDHRRHDGGRSAGPISPPAWEACLPGPVPHPGRLLFAAFVVGHVYLTTTGHAPLALDPGNDDRLGPVGNTGPG